MTKQTALPDGIDAVFKGQAYGGVAKALLANGMKAAALRTNALLRHEEWLEIDADVVAAAAIRLVGIQDMISRGLTYDLKDGLGTTVLAYEEESDMADARLDMDGASKGDGDRIAYDIGYLPLPIIHRDFTINVRTLNASRKLGQPLDTRSSAIAARKVSEKAEEVFFAGAGTYNFGGGSLQGLLNKTGRNTGTLGGAWDTSAMTGALILKDVRAMKQKSITAKHYGPFGLYIPTTYETKMDDDFSTAKGDLTIRGRLEMVDQLEFVHVADKCTDTNVVLLELQKDTVEMVIGMDPTVVEWDTEGGMISHFKVMAIMVPRLARDYAGNSGITHYSE